MSDLRIRATLCAESNYRPASQMPENIYLTRGASGYFTYDLLNKAYFDFNDLVQLDFIFKQNKDIYVYSLYNDDGSLDQEHFSHEIDEVGQKTSDYILLMLSPEETTRFKATKPGKEIKFEIRVTYSSGVIIEPQFDVIVVDSIIANKVEIPQSTLEEDQVTDEQSE